MNSILKMEGVTKTYRPPGRREVVGLSDVSLDVEPGAFKVVCGPSGSGKTTLLLAAGGLQEPESGSVMVNGRNIYALSSEQRARFRAGNIGFVFQQFHLIPFLDVLENVLCPTLALPGENSRDKAVQLIESFGLSHRIDHPPSELSTGERQRVALARAVLNEPALLLADEPTGNLDEKNAQTVLAYFRDFANQGGAVLMATHFTGVQADEKICLENGALSSD